GGRLADLHDALEDAGGAHVVDRALHDHPGLGGDACVRGGLDRVELVLQAHADPCSSRTVSVRSPARSVASQVMWMASFTLWGGGRPWPCPGRARSAGSNASAGTATS